MVRPTMYEDNTPIKTYTTYEEKAIDIILDRIKTAPAEDLTYLVLAFQTLIGNDVSIESESEIDIEEKEDDTIKKPSLDTWYRKEGNVEMFGSYNKPYTLYIQGESGKVVYKKGDISSFSVTNGEKTILALFDE